MLGTKKTYIKKAHKNLLQKKNVNEVSYILQQLMSTMNQISSILSNKSLSSSLINKAKSKLHDMQYSYLN